jgi:hypothetical protein
VIGPATNVGPNRVRKKTRPACGLLQCRAIEQDAYEAEHREGQPERHEPVPLPARSHSHQGRQPGRVFENDQCENQNRHAGSHGDLPAGRSSPASHANEFPGDPGKRKRDGESDWLPRCQQNAGPDRDPRGRVDGA